MPADPVPDPLTWRPRVRVTAGEPAGRATLRATGVRVEQVLRLLAAGRSPADVLRDVGGLEPADVLACVAYAADVLAAAPAPPETLTLPPPAEAATLPPAPEPADAQTLPPAP